jgi:hypothetical protein
MLELEVGISVAQSVMRHGLAWRALLQTRPNVTSNLEHFAEPSVEHCVKYVIKL